MNSYKIIDQQEFFSGEYSIVPIRSEDRYDIMEWRNKQMYHLRQNEPLTKEKQDIYFDSVISNLFNQDKPAQILFSYLKGKELIGYGGLVHLNWLDKNAEISFLMDPALELNQFEFHWSNFLNLLEEVAWKEVNLYKIYTYAYDLRPRLYTALDKAGFRLDAELTEHCFFQNKFLDVKIHAKYNKENIIRKINLKDLEITYGWAINPEVRKFSYNKNSIPLKEHAAWFFNTLEDSNKEYYLLEVNGKEAGSIRFDIEQNKIGKINYLLDPNFTGRGLGTYLLKNGIEFLQRNRPSIKKVYGFVLKENLASVKIFEKLQFKTVSEGTSELKFEKSL